MNNFLLKQGQYVGHVAVKFNGRYYAYDAGLYEMSEQDVRKHMWHHEDLDEMAKPTAEQKKKAYYHGTSSKTAAISIIKNGMAKDDRWVRPLSVEATCP